MKYTEKKTVRAHINFIRLNSSRYVLKFCKYSFTWKILSTGPPVVGRQEKCFVIFEGFAVTCADLLKDYNNISLNGYLVQLQPNTHRRRRRDSTVEFSRVGGVYAPVGCRDQFTILQPMGDK